MPRAKQSVTCNLKQTALDEMSVWVVHLEDTVEESVAQGQHFLHRAGAEIGVERAGELLEAMRAVAHRLLVRTARHGAQLTAGQ